MRTEASTSGVKTFALLLFAGIVAAADAPVASLAIVNARVWTGDSSQPWATAIAAAGEHILAVGAEEESAPF